MEMKRRSIAEVLLIEEITKASQKVKVAVRGLGIGVLIKSIRLQLGMSQKALAQLAKIPQSSVSRIEQGQKDMSLSTVSKILEAVSCDLIVVPLLKDSIDAVRRKRARKIAEKQVRYLKGTMNLENQQPDSPFIEELLKQEEERLLKGPSSKLWED